MPSVFEQYISILFPLTMMVLFHGNIMNILLLDLLLIFKVTKLETTKSNFVECTPQVHLMPSYVEFSSNSADDQTCVSLLVISLTLLVAPQLHSKWNLELVFGAVQINVTTVPEIKEILSLIYIFGEGISIRTNYLIWQVVKFIIANKHLHTMSDFLLCLMMVLIP